MYCTRCGHGNPDGANFCARCGAPLAAATDDTTLTLHVGTAEEAEGEHEELSVSLEELAPDQGVLVVKRGPNAGSTFLLDKDRTSAGRHPSSDIFLDDITVSRRHAEVMREGQRFLVKDVGSLNGTYINRERVDVAELASGDELQIGKFKLMFFAAKEAS
ncbi:MAG TPA: FHA domain-containing protein [Actinomycetota bacterium]|nr:FHA domain-containing protein [Actinomycetota bacterium]